MTRLLPLFPLDAVLLPGTHLPFHVFEPRYRAMLADALAGERLLGLHTLDPAAPPLPDGRPALLPFGCAGEIVEHEPLADGRSNIVLLGTFRYRVTGERPGRAYRLAEVEEVPVRPLPQGPEAPGRRELRRLLARSVDRLAVSVGRTEARRLPGALSDEGLVNEAASRLGLGTEERYALLAMDALADRYAWVLDHVRSLQMRVDLLAPYRRQDVDPRWN
ncbi:MAG: LON peptidase substrate-binding domain-containing protein [Thermoanaerobaculia bacterium]